MMTLSEQQVSKAQIWQNC